MPYHYDDMYHTHIMTYRRDLYSSETAGQREGRSQLFHG